VIEDKDDGDEFIEGRRRRREATSEKAFISVVVFLEVSGMESELFELLICTEVRKKRDDVPKGMVVSESSVRPAAFVVFSDGDCLVGQIVR
jgi:hypothetical protein